MTVDKDDETLAGFTVIRLALLASEISHLISRIFHNFQLAASTKQLNSQRCDGSATPTDELLCFCETHEGLLWFWPKCLHFYNAKAPMAGKNIEVKKQALCQRSVRTFTAIPFKPAG